MRFEPARAFVAARVLPPRAAATLPPQLAFLRAFAIPDEVLRGAVARARRQGVTPLRALLAAGAVSETRYYACLARHLGLPFVADWPRLRTPCEVREAVLRGRVALADDARARWLLAPAERDVATLLRARARGLAPAATAIATPSHLARLLCHRAGAGIAHAASLALPEARPRHSARGALSPVVAAVGGSLLVALLAGAVCGWQAQAVGLGLVFLAGLIFRLIVCAEGLAAPAPAPAPPLADAALPTYAILVPLKDEACMADGLVAALDALDYPRAKREVLLLVEADDAATRAALTRPLPPGFAVVAVPPGAPRTKPRALNVGLLLTCAELVTVYDAEDRPDPDQLRRAAARFAKAPAELACLQARLAIDRGHGLLARLFAIEYAVLFQVFDVGLAHRRLPLALGGTSNHFRAEALRAAGGWDAWNVTEDADLGLRLARLGYDCAMLDSTTWEEAPARLAGWLKQRRRWTKGWLQTLLVLARDLPAAARELGPRRALVVALLLTNLVAGPLLTPLFLVVVLAHLARAGLPTPGSPVELAAATLAFAVIALGGLGTLWCGRVGARARGIAGWRSVLAFLPYQLLIALAAWGGLIDLVRRPYHWHKTAHGAAGRAATPAARSPSPALHLVFRRYRSSRRSGTSPGPNSQVEGQERPTGSRLCATQAACAARSGRIKDSADQS